MGVRGTMMRLGLTLIWRFDMTSGYLIVTILLMFYFIVLGMQFGYLDLLGWRLHYSSWPDFFIVDSIGLGIITFATLVKIPISLTNLLTYV